MRPITALATCAALAALALVAPPARSAELSIEFAGGGSEVTLAFGQTVQIDVVWTMQPTDEPGTLLAGLNLRFNVNDVPDPDGTDRNDAFVVESVSTPMPGWTIAATTGIGGFFSELGLFLSATHPDAADGVFGDGSEFRTVVASFVLRRAAHEGGDTYITIRHRTADDPLPDAIHEWDGFEFEWELRWQREVDGPLQFTLGRGNPGDGGPQWPIHGIEPFLPLVIHGDPAEPPPPDDDDPPPDDDAPPPDDDPPPDDPDPPAPDDGSPPDDDGSTPDDTDSPGDLPSDPSGPDPTEPGPDDADWPPPAYEPPDRDGDGVMSDRDLCPFTPRGRPVDANGCSIDDPMRPAFDADGDGVLDPLDDCPNTRRGDLADARGCSWAQRDDDGDGVRNGLDFCADTPPGEKVNHLGCPLSRMDSDADGVADAYDLCPDTPPGQEVERDGCQPERPAVLLRPAAPGGGAGGGACGAMGWVPIGGLILAGLRLRASNRWAL